MSDVDRLSAQHEASELKRKYLEQRTKIDNLDDQHRQLLKSHREISITVEALGKDLAEERFKNSEIEKERDKWRLVENSEKQFKTIIFDLETEKALIQSELNKMLESRFGAQRDEEYQVEIEKVKSSLLSMNSENAQLKEETQQLRETILDLEGKNDLTQYRFLQSKIIVKQRSQELRNCSTDWSYCQEELMSI